MSLETLKHNTEGIWGQAVLAKERIILAHHRLKSDPRLAPQLFTKEKRYQHGRALIAFKDQKAAKSREEADWQFYSKLMSNKYKDGSLSDRKKPQLFLTRDALSTLHVKRVLSKFCREFGDVPMEIGRKAGNKRKIVGVAVGEREIKKTNRWRKNVNDFVLERFGKIYSPKHSSKLDQTPSMPSLSHIKSAPSSPSPLSPKRLTFSTLSTYALRSSDRKETEAINIKQEIKRAKRESVDERLKLGIGNLKSMDSVKVKGPQKQYMN